MLLKTSLIPTAANQRLGVIAFGGPYSSTNYRSTVAVSAWSEQAWSAGTPNSYGSALVFETTPNTTNTARLERMRITNTGSVGIGTTSPASALDIAGSTAASSQITLTGYGRNGALITRRANGTPGNETQVLAGHQIFGFGSRPWFNDTSTFSSSSLANVAFFASENITSTTKGSYITFGTTANGNNSVSERMRIDNAGNVGVGITNPGSKLTVAGLIESTTGGIRFPDGTTQTTATGGGSGGTLVSGWPDTIVCNVTNPSIGITTFYLTVANYALDGLYYYRRINSSSNHELKFNSDGSFNSYGTISASNCAVSIAALYTAGQAFQNVGGGSFIWTTSGANTYYSGGNVGIGTTNPSSKLAVAGTIESTTGGIRFPDGTVQTTATAGGSGGTIFIGWPDMIQCNVTNPSWGPTVFIATLMPYAPDGLYHYRPISGSNYEIKYNSDGSHNSYVNITASDCGSSIATILSNGKGYSLVGGGSNLWTASGVHTYFGGGNVGIGTTSPQSLLDVTVGSGASLARFGGGGAPTSNYVEIMHASAGTTSINRYAASGSGASLDISALPVDGSSAASIRFFRSTNTSGSRNVDFMRGDNSTTVDHRLVSGANGASFFAANGGNVGIGTTNPTAKLFVAGDITASRAGRTAISAYDTASGIQVTCVADSNLGHAYIGTISDHELDFRTDNSIRMLIDRAGKIGIGTTSPVALLNLMQASNASDKGLMISNSGNTANARFWMDGSNQVRISGNATESLNVIINGSGTGNVGIGTTAPVNRLDIYGTAGRFQSFPSNGRVVFTSNDNTAPPILTLRNTQETAGYGAGIQFDLGYSGTSSVVGTAVTSAKISAIAENTYTSIAATQDAGLQFMTATDGAVSEKLRITSSGYVGIGTTSPAYPLSVHGATGINVPLWLRRTSNTDANAMMYQPAGSITASNPIWWTGIAANSTSFAIGFNNSGSYGGTQALAIDASGNVGIGTTSPSTALQVAGDISKVSWTSDGIQFSTAAQTLTDITGSGTVTNRSANAFSSPTFASANAVTLTNAINLYVAAPAAAGANTTITNSWAALFAGNIKESGSAPVFEINDTRNQDGYTIGDAMASLNFTSKDSSGTGLAGATRTSIIAYHDNTSASAQGLQFWTRNIGSFTEKMRIDSVGNVGIGTTSPNSQLSFGQSLNAARGGYYATGAPGSVPRNDVVNIFEQAENRYGLGIHGSTLELYTSGAASQAIQLGTRSNDGNGTFSPKMSVNSDGNVGIGTTVPGASLEVSSSSIIGSRFLSSSADARIRIVSTAAVSTSNTAAIDFAANSSTQERSTGQIYASFTDTTDATRTSKMRFITYSNGGSVEAMSVAASGVGIGTATPASLLHVYNSAGAKATIGANSIPATTYTTDAGALPLPSGHAILNLTNAGNLDDQFVGITMNADNATDTGQGAYIGSLTTTANFRSPIVFGQKLSASTFAERMRIDANGNVGIGTTSPNSNLSVQNDNSSNSIGLHTTMYQTDKTFTSTSAVRTDYNWTLSSSGMSGVYASSAATFIIKPLVATGMAVNGAVGGASGIALQAFRNANGATSDDNGTMGNLQGIQIGYGHLNTNTNGNPQTTNAYGVKIAPYYRTGTITNMYDLFIDNPQTGGSVIKHYGVYQKNSSANNYFSGNVGIGTATPTAKFEIAGNVSAPNWGTSGIGFKIPAATYTNTTSSGTINSSIHVIASPTLVASNPTTVNIATLAISAPTMSTNVAGGTVAALSLNGNFVQSVGATSFSGGTTPSFAGLVNLTGNRSAPSWTTNGGMLAVGAYTLTNTNGSGTIANQVASGFGAPTFASSSALTVTNASTLYIAGAPSAGTNTTITNAQALHVAGGSSYFGGNVGIGITSPSTTLGVSGTVAANWFQPVATSTSFLGTGMYVSNSGGGSYPFNGTGHVVLQSRSSLNRDIVFVTGSTPSVKMVVESSGNVGIGTTIS